MSKYLTIPTTLREFCKLNGECIELYKQYLVDNEEHHHYELYTSKEKWLAKELELHDNFYNSKFSDTVRPDFKIGDKLILKDTTSSQLETFTVVNTNPILFSSNGGGTWEFPTTHWFKWRSYIFHSFIPKKP